MRLWLVQYVEGAQPWAESLYDCLLGAVVRAPDETTARSLVGDTHEREGRVVWHDPARVTVTELDASGEAGVVLRDFCNG